MAFLYLLIGLCAAVIAAAPPGAANIVVIDTVIEKTVKQALFIVVGAGIGEVLLSLIALHCSISFTRYFEDNPWVQIVVFCLFFLVGTFFLLRNYISLSIQEPDLKKLNTPKVVTGFLLGFLNPPVLLFWVLAFTIIHKYILMVSEMSPFLTLLMFFIGVFLGKVITLYVYGKVGETLDANTSNSNKKDRFVGIALVLVGLVQGVRFIIE